MLLFSRASSTAPAAQSFAPGVHAVSFASASDAAMASLASYAAGGDGGTLLRVFVSKAPPGLCGGDSGRDGRVHQWVKMILLLPHVN